MNLGLGELLVILVIVMLLVGAKRLPEIGRSLGGAVKAFQDALRARPGDDERRAGGKSDDGQKPSEKS